MLILHIWYGPIRAAIFLLCIIHALAAFDKRTLVREFHFGMHERVLASRQDHAELRFAEEKQVGRRDRGPECYYMVGALIGGRVIF